jgi:hypothetical protein
VRGDRRGRRRSISNRASPLAVIVFAAVTLSGTTAGADPLRLRGDAYAQTPQPSGLLVLQGEDRAKPWLSAEALAWLGTGVERTGLDRTGTDGARADRAGAAGTGAGSTGDVLTLIVRARDPEGRGEVRAGRFLVATGAIRPLHIDGASALGRTPWGTSVEAFGGAPVVPRFGEREYDWAVGGRAAQTLAQRATLGFAYLHRRDRGRLADEEIGGDFAAVPMRGIDLATRAAYDLVTLGVTDALASVAFRTTDLRVELFGTRRSPSRLLPATSLFSVLGDVPSTRAGTTIFWRAAPRLDVLATMATQIIDGRVGGDGTLRTTLRTNEEGTASVGLELRRQAVPGAAWSGIRAIGTAPITTRLRTAAEIEIARSDEPDRRGDVWPWALVALTWRVTPSWDIAAAAEASATSTSRSELVALLRASYAWDSTPKVMR